MPLVCTASTARTIPPSTSPSRCCATSRSACSTRSSPVRRRRTPSTSGWPARYSTIASTSRSSGLHPWPAWAATRAAPRRVQAVAILAHSPRRDAHQRRLLLPPGRGRSEDVDSWQLHFLVAARSDPSYQVSLAEYWPLSQKARAEAPGRSAPASNGSSCWRLAPPPGSIPPSGTASPRPPDRPHTDVGPGVRLPPGARLGPRRRRHTIAVGLVDAPGSAPGQDPPQDHGQPEERLRRRQRNHMSMDSLISYQYQLSIGGEVVDEREWQQLVEARTPLVQFRGQWMQLDREKMQQMLQFWQSPAARGARAGAARRPQDGRRDGRRPRVGPRRGRRSDARSAPGQERLRPVQDPASLQGTLRDYQRRGVAWLQYLENSASTPASRTTWASARPSRSSPGC